MFRQIALVLVIFFSLKATAGVNSKGMSEMLSNLSSDLSQIVSKSSFNNVSEGGGSVVGNPGEATALSVIYWAKIGIKAIGPAEFNCNEENSDGSPVFRLIERDGVVLLDVDVEKFFELSPSRKMALSVMAVLSLNQCIVSEGSILSRMEPGEGDLERLDPNFLETLVGEYSDFSIKRDQYSLLSVRIESKSNLKVCEDLLLKKNKLEATCSSGLTRIYFSKGRWFLEHIKDGDLFTVFLEREINEE